MFLTNGRVLNEWKCDAKVGFFLGAGGEAVEVVELARRDANVNNVAGDNGGGGRPEEE